MNIFRLAPPRAILTVTLTAMLFALAATATARIDADWHIRIREAAVVTGDTVLLGEIADPVGTINPQNWRNFAATPLWPAPPRPGQPMTISNTRLREELTKRLGDIAALTEYPSSLALQRGGGVVLGPQLHTLVVESLTRFAAQKNGEVRFRDVQLPPFVFLRDSRNRVELETPTALTPGQIPVRLREVTPNGELVRRLTGGAFMDQWITVPCAAIPVNRHDSLTPDSITFVKKNLAYLRGELWDGKGGPWRVLRSIGAGSVIYRTDLERVPTLAKGTKVDLIYQGKRLRLTVPAEAMADGKPGEMIPVRNLQSRREVYATVHDEGTVVISN